MENFQQTSSYSSSSAVVNNDMNDEGHQSLFQSANTDFGQTEKPVGSHLFDNAYSVEEMNTENFENSFQYNTSQEANNLPADTIVGAGNYYSEQTNNNFDGSNLNYVTELSGLKENESNFENYKYQINYDPHPQVIRKENNDQITYKQEVAVRYLQPPTPPPPGPIIIKEVRPPAPPPAPPVIIRQRPPRAPTPPPLVVRENPPQPPTAPGPKIITKQLPPVAPPPRRVIIERLPPLPPKPRSLIVERWLPYKQQKRRVIYQRAKHVENQQPVKNLIIQWGGANTKVVKEVHNLGIIKVNPMRYTEQYSGQLRDVGAIQSALQEFGMDINNEKLQVPNKYRDQLNQNDGSLYATDEAGLDFGQNTINNFEDRINTSSTINQIRTTSNYDNFDGNFDGNFNQQNFSDSFNSFATTGTSGFETQNILDSAGDSNGDNSNMTEDIQDIIRKYSIPGFKTFEVRGN